MSMFWSLSISFHPLTARSLIVSKFGGLDWVILHMPPMQEVSSIKCSGKLISFEASKSNILYNCASLSMNGASANMMQTANAWYISALRLLARMRLNSVSHELRNSPKTSLNSLLDKSKDEIYLVSAYYLDLMIACSLVLVISSLNMGSIGFLDDIYPPICFILNH